ncbi:MAG: hypothetical protein A3I76_05320 [Elusimicrobia bacterium RIFCSPLOWO2_02_FULL_61_11]|nr:MAG: hypothetical protein A3I76_05320 [Elusimicrobia bacterium RIFCSPLOWO2_02_FULL_61_11]
MKRPRSTYLCACLTLAAALFCAPPAPASARYYYSWEKKPPKSFFIKTRVRRWQTRTSGQVRASIVTPADLWSPPTDNISMGNTNDFKVMDAPLYLLSAEVQPVRGFSLEFETGDNKFSGGKYFEHDWLHATNKTLYLYSGAVWESPQHRDYAKSRAETGGTARQYSLSAYLNVYKTDPLAQDEEYEVAHSLDFFAGYSWYGTKVRLFNGYTIMSTDVFLPTPPVGPTVGLNSRATMIWSGWRAGFREQATLGKNFFAEGKLAFGPLMKYKGSNYWNLDTALQNPGIRSSATGTLVEFSLSASYRFWKYFEFEGGWMAWSYKAASGKQTYYYTDGSTWEGKLNKVSATRKGAFFGLSWKY